MTKDLTPTSEYVYENKDYILYHGQNLVYIKFSKKTVYLSENIFWELQRSLWREDKNDRRNQSISLNYKNDEFREEWLDQIPNTGFKVPIEEEIKEKIELIKQFIQQLKPIQQDIIEDIYFNDKTEKEVGRRLNISQQMVNYHKRAALKILAERYLEEERL